MANETFYMPESLQLTGPLGTVLPVFTQGLAEGSMASRIMRAAVTGDAAGLKSLLAQPEALPDFANAEGITPLMVAAARGHAAVAEMLAAHPLVNLARPDARGWTALHVAAALQQPALVKILLDHRAPFNIQNTNGNTPFMLAGGGPAEEIFWQDRRFARTQKRPEAPANSETPASPAAPPAAESTLRDAFYNAALNVGLQWPVNRIDRRQQQAVYGRELGKLPLTEFKAAFAKVTGSDPDFDWRSGFFGAARHNNTEVMTYLHEKFMYQQDVLNGALGLAVEAADNREAAHHLLRWGADASAPLAPDSNRTIHQFAFNNLRLGCFEEIVLLSRQPLPKDTLLAYEKTARRFYWAAALRAVGPKAPLNKETVGKLLQDNIFKACARRLQAVKAGLSRHTRKGLGAKKLREHFNAAAERQDLLEVMAVYIEARTDRFFRGSVALSDESGGAALALALLHDRMTFARMLAGDGYKLQHAAPALRRALEERGSPAAKAFAAAERDGTLNVKPLEKIGVIRASDFYPGMFMGRMGY